MRIYLCFLLCLSALSCGTALSAKEAPRLLLPDEFYAYPGLETNVYFSNVFKTLDPSRYFFLVKCSKGKLMQKFWTFTPQAQDTGVYDWTLEVYDDNGKVAGKTIKLKVLSAARKPDGNSILLIGDSLTDQSHHVRRLKQIAPGLNMIGSNGGLGKKPSETGIAHEGYGGWTWANFANSGKPFIPKRLSYRSNKFVIEKNGQWVHSFDAFFQKYGNGKKPQFVVIQLGGNDIFSRNDQNIDETLQSIGRSMEKLIGEIRKSVPDAFIGIGLVPPAAGQDAWGKGYGCSVNSYQFNKNRWKLNFFYMTRVAEMARTDTKISIIPTFLGMDPETAFPISSFRPNSHTPGKVLRQSNALHPNASGGAQMGDIYYCWLVRCLSGK